jgi:glycosyltransferase involved in cell wall biosynthesis
MPGGIVARRLKRKFGVPYIITPHGSDVPGHNRRRLRLSHMLAKPWWRRICSQADCVVSPSGSLLGLIKETGVNCRGAVIHNGFEAEKFIPLQKEKRILLCGRMVEGKGFDHFLEGIRDLELPGWTVDMVGDGPLYPSLCSMASKSKVSVTMHGWIDRSDPRLAELYGKAMVFVFPSEFENFSIALLEAMGAGCAVVATKIADNSEVIGNTGVLVRAKEPDELRQAIIGLSGDPDTCLRLGKGARQRALELFDWKSISWKYLKLLEAIGLGDSSETGFSPPLYHSGTK